MAFSISLAALIFRGNIADGLPRAASSFLLGGGVIGVVVAWRSQLRTTIATSQDLSAIAILAAASTIATGPADDPVATVIVLLAIAALVTGVCMFLIGRFGLSRIVRFLPSTVVMGFLAGTGWLLIRGGVEVAINRTIELAEIGELFGSATKFWLPALGVALYILVSSQVDWLPSSALGAVILGCIGVFYAIVASVSSVDEVGDAGWLIGPFGEVDRWRPLSPEDFSRTDWGEIGHSAIPLAVMAFVSIIGALLNVTGLEALRDDRVDLDNELEAAGLANLLIAPLGGLIGFHMLGDTTLAIRNGVRGKRVPILIGAMSIVMGLVAASAVGYTPRFVAGGLILGVGCLLMLDWLQSLLRSRNSDSLVSIAIVVVIMFFGMLPGVGFGIVAASAIFLYRYSRIDPIRSARTGSDVRSTVERSDKEHEVLHRRGDQVRILRIHGYLFFGSIEALYQQVQALIDDGQTRTIILDFHRVEGIDHSALVMLDRIERTAASQDIVLLWSRLASEFHAVDEFDEAALRTLRTFVDLDRALEYAEELLLAETPRPPQTLSLSTKLVSQFQQRTYDKGDFIVRQGETDSTIYVVLAGSCEVELPHDGGVAMRLRHFGVGSMFGEVGFRTGAPRTADVRATLDGTTLLALSREESDALEIEDPKLALELSNFILDTNSRRMAQLTRQLHGELG